MVKKTNAKKTTKKPTAAKTTTAAKSSAPKSPAKAAPAAKPEKTDVELNRELTNKLINYLKTRATVDKKVIEVLEELTDSAKQTNISLRMLATTRVALADEDEDGEYTVEEVEEDETSDDFLDDIEEEEDEEEDEADKIELADDDDALELDDDDDLELDDDDDLELDDDLDLDIEEAPKKKSKAKAKKSAKVKTWTIAQITELLQQVGTKCGMNIVKKLVTEFKVKKLSQLKEKDYPRLVARCEEELAKEDDSALSDDFDI